MEITLITRNGITPNPTIDFIELCNLAINSVNDNAFADILLDGKYKELCTEDALLDLQKTFLFGKLIITLNYVTRDNRLQHRFCTHYDSVYGCTGTELNPVMYAY
jgi:hypothetical protein